MQSSTLPLVRYCSSSSRDSFEVAAAGEVGGAAAGGGADNASYAKDDTMLDPQARTRSPCAAATPCPRCQSRMEVQRIAAARTGFEHWTLRCTECGLIHEAQINAGSMKSDAVGWEDSDLRGSQQGR